MSLSPVILCLLYYTSLRFPTVGERLIMSLSSVILRLLYYTSLRFPMAGEWLVMSLSPVIHRLLCLRPPTVGECLVVSLMITGIIALATVAIAMTLKKSRSSHIDSPRPSGI